MSKNSRKKIKKSQQMSKKSRKKIKKSKTYKKSLNKIERIKNFGTQFSKYLPLGFVSRLRFSCHFVSCYPSSAFNLFLPKLPITNGKKLDYIKKESLGGIGYVYMDTVPSGQNRRKSSL